MDSKIFLGKYRVAAEEMKAVGDIADSPSAYEAEEIDSGKKVIVEVVPAASVKAAARERLEAEAITVKKLSHVNILALHDFGVEDDHLVYVTEDFEGTPAEEWVNAHGPMPVGPVLRIAAQVVSALGAAAFHRINHHAINPSNVVLAPGQTAEGEWPLVKVLHLVGVAPKYSGTDVAVAAFDKSLHYASPEQIQKGTVDFRSELYSLGATMWFLLTGAPPLVAPAGPMAAPPATNGVAAEKINAMPKKVRLLLAKMLAVNPETRPRDPLAFYRKLQDCLHQVERRETMSRALGIPAFSTAASGTPHRRRFPTKALALAALFLAIATVAGLVLTGYLRHGRIIRAEEPIGKPIGVPEASPTPVSATTNAIASKIVPLPTAVADLNSAQSAPPTNAESPADSARASSTDSAVASTSHVEVPPGPPAVSDSPKEMQSPEPAPAVASNTNASPAAIESREVASNEQAEPTSVESPDADAGAGAAQTAPKKKTMREVRRAEPAPPEDGPESAASETTAAESEPKAPEKSPAKKTERPAKPKRQAEKKTYRREPMSGPERTMPRLPNGSEAARFIGVTPEGWWMLESPSGKIIIVPPPSSSR